MIKGYKCFNKNLTNRYGRKFAIGETYSTKGNIKFGNDGKGFHLCTNFEDTFRYFDSFNEEVELCEVIGFGKTDQFDDYNYDYFDMYAVEILHIIRIIPRDEIIEMALNLNILRIIRFIQGYKLTPNEMELFKNKFYNNEVILNTISYYQENDKMTYTRKNNIK